MSSHWRFGLYLVSDMKCMGQRYNFFLRLLCTTFWFLSMPLLNIRQLGWKHSRKIMKISLKCQTWVNFIFTRQTPPLHRSKDNPCWQTHYAHESWLTGIPPSAARWGQEFKGKIGYSWAKKREFVIRKLWFFRLSSLEQALEECIKSECYY